MRLRPARDPDSFLPYDNVLGTMLHELVHNVRGPHDGWVVGLLCHGTAPERIWSITHEFVGFLCDKVISDTSSAAQPCLHLHSCTCTPAQAAPRRAGACAELRMATQHTCPPTATQLRLRLRLHLQRS